MGGAQGCLSVPSVVRSLLPLPQMLCTARSIVATGVAVLKGGLVLNTLVCAVFALFLRTALGAYMTRIIGLFVFRSTATIAQTSGIVCGSRELES